ncbi:tyrosine--tRNA ligase [Rhodocaloribacter litoris]|uniref:tyrosine--tRNA ligase n=1 Tax=Rhodocaloribacter litoris TaxID=2558931 RepID=UPI001421E392|nr:tyrosine--tRNA ligase [Rhodocaloribacter litoris]QXD14477.1 tyrosine--tRNA ligase [Rhodocaloribacter litoris]
METKTERATASTGTRTNLYDEYAWRGMVYHATPELPEVLACEKVTAYIGFDPTARSLHVGSLLPIMALARLQRFGHTPIAVVGGGTGLIGDPSGKSQERPLLTRAQVAENLEGIRNQLAHFLDFDAVSNPARIVNNLDWLGALSLVDFLRDVGKYFTVNYMLAKESVKRRIASEDGISYTEFTYMLLQAYDYYVLHERYGCTLQMGGSDQWGNILAGTDLIRRVAGAKAHGLVFPLVTTAGGTKFGKTEAGTVWLDPELTSPYRFYQFWLNTDDQDVVTYLKYFTWLPPEEVDALATLVETAPERREAQRTLAREVTRTVHGETALARAERASAVLFGGELGDLSLDELRDIFEDVPSAELPRAAFEGEGLGVVDLFAESGLASSKGEARRLVRSGGAYVNNVRVPDEQHRVTLEAAVEGQALVLRKGRKHYQLVWLR